ncbi:hypothetical protein [Hyalangium sp.]|uniref:hypothetical protein n=1 Tax=Hyalangium sp. TaxID=2028555 RepID=UPI002D3E2147|nr:hypothetical protein [Hyalangium sp.]HYH98151.1 hypothetical protein [Hyalangium sp.]
MTPAQSPRLRTRCLLLLAPLLVAATPSPLPLAHGLVLAQPTRPERLVFVEPPPEILVHTCVPIIVETQNPLGVPINLGIELVVTVTKSPPLGSFYDSETCETPTASVIIPIGATRQQVWFEGHALGRVTLEVNDGPFGLIDSMSRPISIVPSFTNNFVFSGVPSSASTGNPITFAVTALDDRGQPAQAYSGRVRLSSTLPVPGLPREDDFNPPVDQGRKTYSLTFPAAGTYQLTLEDVNNPDLVAESQVITVTGPTLPPKVSVYASRPNPVPACEPVRFDLAVLDSSGDPASATATVRFCRTPDRTATLVSHSFELAAFEGNCVVGTFFSTANMIWTNTRAEDVTFTVSDATAEGPVTVSWRPMLSPERSGLWFQENSDGIPLLNTFNEQLTLQFDARDTCGNPIIFPADKTLAFSATPPLFVGAAVKENSGRWTAPVALKKCPEDRTATLAIWPTLDGTAIERSPSVRFERLVLPECSEPFVELSIRPRQEGAMAEPGGRVKFEVKLENKGPRPIDAGVLRLSTEGLILSEVDIEGVRLAPSEEGTALPALGTDKPLVVKFEGRATMALDDKARVRAWYTTPEGAPLTPEKAFEFELGGVGVDVGCGCHASSLPGQLLPWLALLLAASRPWERSHRLRRRERIDR